MVSKIASDPQPQNSSSTSTAPSRARVKKHTQRLPVSFEVLAKERDVVVLGLPPYSEVNTIVITAQSPKVVALQEQVLDHVDTVGTVLVLGDSSKYQPSEWQVLRDAFHSAGAMMRAIKPDADPKAVAEEFARGSHEPLPHDIDRTEEVELATTRVLVTSLLSDEEQKKFLKNRFPAPSAKRK